MKKILLLSAIVLMLASCASVNPFTEDNPFVGAIAEDGKYIFTTTDYEEFLSLPLEIERVSGSFDPQTEVLFGAIEGKFSKTIVTAGLNASGQFTKKKGSSITYWIHKESAIEVYVPASGIILFSTANVEQIYEKYFVEKKSNKLEPQIISSLYSNTSALYVKNPKKLPEMDMDLSGFAVDRFDFILLVADKEKYSTAFNLTTEEYANSFFTVLKASYVTMLRQNGQKPDTEYLKLIITQEGNTVNLLDQKMDKNYILRIFNGVLK